MKRTCLTNAEHRLRSCCQLRRFCLSFSRRDANTSPIPSASVLDQRRQNEGRSSTRRPKNFAPRKRIFSGIQPTGVPHLGNYLGALQRWKQLQDQSNAEKNPKNYQLLYAIVDLHALTAGQSHDDFLQKRKESFASLLAIGLDPKHSILFMQSAVPAHTQLMWILSTIASTGYLSRMTQWKSKLDLPDDAAINDEEATEKLKLGLFSYPVLQAADILLYQPDFVPVGEDQAQHIEFTRQLARSFNAHYAPEKGMEFFKPPRLMLSPAKRIMSLKEPTKKMSKSHLDPASRILITDSESTIQERFRKALTDSNPGISYDPATRPGISNLIEILKHASGTEATCEELAAENADVSMRAFKEHVAESVIKTLDGVPDRFAEVMDPKNHAMAEALHDGNVRARALAGDAITKIYSALGLADVVKASRAKEVYHSKHGGMRDQRCERPSAADATGPSASSRAEQIKREQLQEEQQAEHEPDVLPQQHQGVDRPIAS